MRSLVAPVLRILLALSVLLALAVPLCAAGAGLDERIDLKVTRASAEEVLRSFGEVLSVEVELEKPLTAEVTLDLEKVSVRKALYAVCRQAGCRWHVEEGERRRLVISPKK